MAFWRNRTVPDSRRVATQAARAFPLEGSFRKPGGKAMRLLAELNQQVERIAAGGRLSQRLTRWAAATAHFGRSPTTENYVWEWES